MATTSVGMQPIVLEGIKVDELVTLLLEKHTAPSTLIVCGTSDSFIQSLNRATEATDTTQDQPHPLLVNTLRVLGQSRTLHVAFCPSVDAVRAYLSTYEPTGTISTLNIPHQTGQPLLAVLDILDVHRETSSWSAQGLSRTFAVAVEAAHRAGQRLVVTECAGGSRIPAAPDSDEEQAALEDVDLVRGEAVAAEDQGDAARERRSVWDEQVSILNVATKSFGASERGWVGRTVTVRRVAERWCAFRRLKSGTESS